MKIILIMISVLFTVTACTNEQNSPSDNVIQVNSKIFARNFSLKVSLPENYNKNNQYPVIYLLNADSMYSMVNQYVQLNSKDPGVTDSIVVGIFTQTNDSYFLPSLENSKEKGASEFLDFIETELIPFVEKNYSADSSKRILYGHSSAALFSLYSYINKPKLFNAFVASSPTIGWNDQWYLKNMSNQQSELLPQLYMSYGSQEIEAISDAETYLNSGKFKFDRNTLSFRVFTGFKHMGVIPVALAGAVQWSLELK